MAADKFKEQLKAKAFVNDPTKSYRKQQSAGVDVPSAYVDGARNFTPGRPARSHSVKDPRGRLDG
jgi:hypothetical protein